MTAEDVFEEMARLPADDPEAALDLYRRAYRAGATYKSFAVTLTRQQPDPMGFMKEIARVVQEIDADLATARRGPGEAPLECSRHPFAG